jgi:ATP-dependent DNA helicase RecQ
VYVRNRKLTESTAAFLNANKISSLAYHAGLKYEQRQAVQEAWTRNTTQVICATNAFGMGIDKPDVRFVVHLDLPDSLEAYFQEAGRAGRDGKTAYAALFYTKADQQKLQEQFEQAFPPAEIIKKAYQAICNYYQVAVNAGQGLTVDFEIEKICRSYNLTAVQVFNSVKFLEREDYLGLLDLGFEPSRLMFLASKETVYDFQIRQPKFEMVIKTLLRSYGGLYDNYVHVVEKDLAYRCKMSQAAVKEQLETLNKHELISYFPQSSIPKLVFLQNRVHAKYLQLSPDNYKLLKEKAREKMQAVMNYSENNKICRQVQLLMYFNELQFSECGHCDVCIKKKQPSLEKLKKNIVESLAKGPLSMDAMRLQMKFRKDETWINALNDLIDEGTVKEKNNVLNLSDTKS